MACCRALRLATSCSTSCRRRASSSPPSFCGSCCCAGVEACTWVVVPLLVLLPPCPCPSCSCSKQGASRSAATPTGALRAHHHITANAQGPARQRVGKTAHACASPQHGKVGWIAYDEVHTAEHTWLLVAAAAAAHAAAVPETCDMPAL
eukprot:scaffold227598_cov18-Tisochrysis_lutea.AAC.1